MKQHLFEGSQTGLCDYREGTAVCGQPRGDSIHNKLTASQESHLDGIKDRFCRQVDEKYRAGAAEHGGNLWDKTPLQLIDEAIQETIDQYTFLHTLRMQVVEALAKNGK